MKRRPVAAAAAPAYPDRRRARTLALGLLALGGSAIVGAPLVGCGNMRPPDSHAVPGSMVAPELDPGPVHLAGAPMEPGYENTPEPEASSEEGGQQEPCVIPEVGEEIPADPEGRIRGDMAYPDPTRLPEDPPPAILGDMPVPEIEPGPEGQVEKPIPIPGGMPAPVGPIEGDVMAPEIDGDMPMPQPQHLPGEMPIPEESEDE